MGIIDDLYRGGQPAGSGTPIESPYESSFDYFNGLIGKGPIAQPAPQAPAPQHQGLQP